MPQLFAKERRGRTQDVRTAKNVHFSELCLSEPILQGLINAGWEVTQENDVCVLMEVVFCRYSHPSPIQLKAIPLGRFGVDMIAQVRLITFSSPRSYICYKCLSFFDYYFDSSLLYLLQTLGQIRHWQDMCVQCDSPRDNCPT